MKRSIDFRDLLLNEEMVPLWIKHAWSSRELKKKEEIIFLRKEHWVFSLTEQNQSELLTDCCIVICNNYTHIHAEYILTQWIKTSEDFFNKIYLSLYLKGLCVWGGVGDRTELQYIDPYSYGHQRCVFLVLQGCSTGGPEALSAGWWLSLPHLVSNSSDLQLTDFLSSPSYIIVQSPTQSLEWHVWSSSSGNNYHAVQRSLSSGASVYECTMGFYLVPYCQPSPPTRFLLITAIGMSHLLPVHHFGIACLAGSKVNIQHDVFLH